MAHAKGVRGKGGWLAGNEGSTSGRMVNVTHRGFMFAMGARPVSPKSMPFHRLIPDSISEKRPNSIPDCSTSRFSLEPATRGQQGIARVCGTLGQFPGRTMAWFCIVIYTGQHAGSLAGREEEREGGG